MREPSPGEVVTGAVNKTLKPEPVNSLLGTHIVVHRVHEVVLIDSGYVSTMPLVSLLRSRRLSFLPLSMVLSQSLPDSQLLNTGSVVDELHPRLGTLEP